MGIGSEQDSNRESDTQENIRVEKGTTVKEREKKEKIVLEKSRDSSPWDSFLKKRKYFFIIALGVILSIVSSFPYLHETDSRYIASSDFENISKYDFIYVEPVKDGVYQDRLGLCQIDIFAYPAICRVTSVEGDEEKYLNVTYAMNNVIKKTRIRANRYLGNIADEKTLKFSGLMVASFIGLLGLILTVTGVLFLIFG